MEWYEECPACGQDSIPAADQDAARDGHQELLECDDCGANVVLTYHIEVQATAELGLRSIAEEVERHG